MDSLYLWLGIMVAVGIAVWLAAPHHHGMIDQRSDSDDTSQWD